MVQLTKSSRSTQSSCHCSWLVTGRSGSREEEGDRYHVVEEGQVGGGGAGGGESGIGGKKLWSHGTGDVMHK